MLATSSAVYECRTVPSQSLNLTGLSESPPHPPPDGMEAIFDGIYAGVMVPVTPFALMAVAMLWNVLIRFSVFVGITSISSQLCFSSIILFIGM